MQVLSVSPMIWIFSFWPECWELQHVWHLLPSQKGPALDLLGTWSCSIAWCMCVCEGREKREGQRVGEERERERDWAEQYVVISTKPINTGVDREALISADHQTWDTKIIMFLNHNCPCDGIIKTQILWPISSPFPSVFPQHCTQDL